MTYFLENCGQYDFWQPLHYSFDSYSEAYSKAVELSVFESIRIVTNRLEVLDVFEKSA